MMQVQGGAGASVPPSLVFWLRVLMASRSEKKTDVPMQSVARHSAPTHLKALFSYRLNRLAFVSSRLAAVVNESRYNMGPRDWRIIALLAAQAPMSLNALARESNVDKSQASRTVADLIERKLIKRSADALDGRGVSLDLTAAGRAFYKKVFPTAVDRNEELLSVLSEHERDVVEVALDKLTAHGLHLLDEIPHDSPPRRGRKIGPR
jgi:DNA-binding MarR family transcriptional regulator